MAIIEPRHGVAHWVGSSRASHRDAEGVRVLVAARVSGRSKAEMVERYGETWSCLKHGFESRQGFSSIQWDSGVV